MHTYFSPNATASVWVCRLHRLTASLVTDSLRLTYSFYHICRVLTSYWPGLFTKTSGTVLRIPIIPSKNPCCWVEILRVETFFLNINSKAKIHRMAIFWGDWGAEKLIPWITLWEERRGTHFLAKKWWPRWKTAWPCAGAKSVLQAECHP